MPPIGHAAQKYAARDIRLRLKGVRKLDGDGGNTKRGCQQTGEYNKRSAAQPYEIVASEIQTDCDEQNERHRRYSNVNECLHSHRPTAREGIVRLRIY